MANKKTAILLVFVFAVVSILSLSYVLAIAPTGGSVTAGTPMTAPADVAGSAAAFAGNVTGLTITGFSTTQSWQGYFGNVTGTIQLADSADNVMYNWSLADPEGEVYSSTNSTVLWSNIQCFNYTALGDYTSEIASGGTTSQFGTNLSQLESTFSIVSDDVDGVDETFTLSGAGTHDQFYTANNQFSQGECINTRVYDNTGAGVNNKFEEALLYEPESASVVFASILDSDAAGFDSATHDFEMLVPENGHGVDISTTTYYFFVELQ